MFWLLFLSEIIILKPYWTCERQREDSGRVPVGLLITSSATSKHTHGMIEGWKWFGTRLSRFFLRDYFYHRSFTENCE